MNMQWRGQRQWATSRPQVTRREVSRCNAKHQGARRLRVLGGDSFAAVLKNFGIRAFFGTRDSRVRGPLEASFDRGICSFFCRFGWIVGIGLGLLVEGACSQKQEFK